MSELDGFEGERARGERFGFGDNWRRFLEDLDDARIDHAKRAFCNIHELTSLQGRSFIDIGSGSGLSSLIARSLGATVHSLDYDPQSVACTQALKDRFFPSDSNWTIERGSALDAEYLDSLGLFDLVYSWGVLHHTGAMWRGIDLASKVVAPGGRLHIAIYLTERSSPTWLRVKQLYNRCPPLAKRGLLGLFAGYSIVRMLARGQNPRLFIRDYPMSGRGMTWIRDVEDWLGGLPYEHATPKEVREFLSERGFELLRHDGMEYVFGRPSAGSDAELPDSGE